MPWDWVRTKFSCTTQPILAEPMIFLEKIADHQPFVEETSLICLHSLHYVISRDSTIDRHANRNPVPDGDPFG